ncbi:hypothetical protein K488DRAFT_60181 [Vararia minispora EC-137]|uniref:Uncharacterized protein n=1 Tax=Vararia minispora EC-137 TaxID=1314806 RepID=A0ACB8Q8G4_9AGAM|nr:hypothetical protein K488DRAFT_60181 [Vararia minispora EC-137]
MDVSDDVDKEEIAKLIAEYGSSSNTSWLEFSRYKIWTADKDIPPSTFRPIQGYLRSDPYIFAWGNPLLSDSTALEQTCLEFWKWCKAQKLKLVWCCVDDRMEKVLGKGSKFGWSTVTCIVEDVLDPQNVVELAQSQGGGPEVKDFKKNIRRAGREGVEVREIKSDGWKDEEKKEVELGIVAWKEAKAGLQLASTSFQPWVDAEHRRYWVAEKDGKIVGILILTSIGGGQYQIKNAASFPEAPRGTSEFLIYSTMRHLEDEDETSEDGPMFWDESDSDRARHPSRHEDASKTTSRSQSRASEDSTASDRPRRVTVTFGISASDEMTPVDNVGGWRVSWLSKTYKKVVGATGITKRGDFRNKFHTEHLPMYVCYPSKQGFGIEGVSKLMKCLRQ